MLGTKIELFSKTLRELESEIGTRDVNIMVLDSLVKAIQALKVENVSDFCEEFGNLFTVISSTEPKFGILNFNFAKLLTEFKTKLKGRQISEKKWKTGVIRSIENILKRSQDDRALLMHNAEAIDVDNKVILIHDHSHTVQDVLCHYRKMGKHFEVVIAEQDHDKTQSNIERMYNAGIPFHVVPAYMLSHIHGQVDMLFFGALTLKDTMNFVMDPGTHATIAEFHESKAKAYMFVDTSKFSLWKSRHRGEIFIHSDRRQHHEKAIEYDRIKYSHDRVPMENFHRIVTNEGVLTHDQLKKLFKKRMKEYCKVVKC